MNLDSPLVTLPDIALRKVLEKCGYMGVQTLRKTCHDLRNFIDDSSLELGMKTVEIVLHPLMASFEYTQENSESLRIEYYHDPESCTVYRFEKKTFKESILNGQQFMDVLNRDLSILFKTLGRQKAPLEELRCMKRSPPNDGRPFEDLTVLRHSLNTGKLLKVQKLWLKGHKESEFFNVLSFVDPKFIKKLHLCNSLFSMPLKVDELAKLDQWKSVQSLTIAPQFEMESIHQFMHFRELKIKVKDVTMEDLGVLYDRFQERNPPKCFEIGYGSRVTPQVYEVFPRAPPARRPRDAWYFKNFFTRDIIHVAVASRSICFKTMKPSSVPANATV